MSKLEQFKKNALSRNYPSDFVEISIAIMESDIETLEEYSELIDDFPNGKDHLVNDNWIIHAIGEGSHEVVEWMLTKNVGVNFRGDDGYTVLLSAIESEEGDKYEMMRSLLKYGADPNLKGINDWTPSHMAGVRNDIKALEILNEFGADLTIRTEIDEYATPHEEAKTCNANQATLDWFKKHTPS